MLQKHLGKLLLLFLFSSCLGETEDQQYDQGVKLYNNNSYEEAIRIFTQILQKEPSNFKARMLRGKSYYYLYLGDSASMDFRHVVKNEDISCGLKSDAYYLLGEIRINGSDYNPDSMKVALHDLDMAITIAESCSDKRTGFDARRQKIYTLLRLEEYSEAIQNSIEYIGLSKSNYANRLGAVYYSKGYAEFQLGKYLRALESFNNALICGDTNSYNYFYRASIYEKLGKDSACYYYDLACSMDSVHRSDSILFQFCGNDS